ncbi:MAG: response regulator transcription factor [Lachnospiraceae bacterium]
MRILVAEDERDLNRVIEKKLTSEGYSVDVCFDGEEALDFLNMAEYDVILLDVMMPKVDGYQVVEQLRRDGVQTPVLFLTAKDTIDDKVKGLDMGANDYLVKPFSFRELLARIRVLTRIKYQNTTNRFTAADLVLDIEAHKVSRAGQVLTLTAKEFALLEVLIRNKNQVLSREQIENHLWNFDYEGGTNVIDVYIRYLRKKIDEPYEQKLIQTVRGVGYVLRDET